MITIQDYQTRFPNNNLEYFNKLSESEKEEYLDLYQKYHSLALKYLINKTSLTSFDKSLKNNEDRFISVNKDDMDMYQFLCSNNLNYFYLRNNLYIERLTSEEMDYLKSADENSDTTEFIERTLQKVITELPNAKEKISLCFGGDNLKFFKPNGSIIIGVRYDEFSDKIPDDDKWIDTYMNSKGELEMMMNTFTYTYPKINSIPVEIIQYNEYSVMELNGEKTNTIYSGRKGENEITKHKVEKTDGKGSNINFY